MDEVGLKVGDIYRHRLSKKIFRITDLRYYQVKVVCISEPDQQEASYNKGAFPVNFEKVEEDFKEQEKEMANGNILAVYGTLKKGYHNHSLINEAGLLPFFCEKGRTEEEFFMAGWGYPIVFTGAPKHMHNAIDVELYYFKDESQLQAIDRLEGHPNFYERKLVKINATLGNQIKHCMAWMYVQPFKNFSVTRHDIEGRVTVNNKVATWGYKQ